LWFEQTDADSTDSTENDGFGISLGVSGNRAVIGAYQDDDKGENAGAAYIFEYADYGSGPTWRQMKKLTASDGDVNDNFGRSVAIDGDRVVVGAYLDDYKVVTFDVVNAGSVYVFDFDGTHWQQSQQLKSEEGVLSANDLFGFSLDLDGDTLLIGAHSDDENGTDSGAAYIFNLENDFWTVSQKLMHGNSGDAFGYATSLDGYRALIGAYLNDDVALNSGAAYIFNYELNTSSWQLDFVNDKLLPNGLNINENNYFGTSVSLDGNNALVGAFFDEDSSNAMDNHGSVSFFHKPSHIVGWGSGQTYYASDADIDDRFGYSVSLHGKTALIGSWLDDDNGGESGSVYVFSQNSNSISWSETDKITADDGAIEDYFGVSVALSNKWKMIGAHREDTPASNSGSVYTSQNDLIFKNDFEFDLL
jgi:hypothetical protein